MTRRPARNHSTETVVQLGNLVLRAQGTYTPGCAGCYSGPPDRCYPDEPGDFSLERVWLLETNAGVEVTSEVPLAVLEELFVAQQLLIPNLDGSTRTIRQAYNTAADEIASLAAEVAELDERERQLAAAQDRDLEWRYDK